MEVPGPRDVRGPGTTEPFIGIPMNKTTKCFVFSVIVSVFLHAGVTFAQAEPDAAAQANNPLANMTAFNIQDYYIGDLSESDETANQA